MTGVELEALAPVSDVKASAGCRHGSRLEPGDWKRLAALTWRKTGPRRTKAYDVTVYDKSEHRSEPIIAWRFQLLSSHMSNSVSDPVSPYIEYQGVSWFVQIQCQNFGTLTPYNVGIP